MNIMKVTEEEGYKQIKDSIIGGIHQTLYMTTTIKQVTVSDESHVDIKLCDKLGYKVLKAYHGGGVLVINPGDFAVQHFDKIDNDWLAQLIPHVLDWLKARGLNAEFVGNDILVDGYKVVAFNHVIHDNIDHSGMFVSISPNLEDIKAICRKPMEKVPKGLSEYGITAEDAEAMFLDFHHNVLREE